VASEDLRRRLFLIDGSSLAFRAFFALPETIATSDGQPTNALYGFSQMLLKVVAEYEPRALVVAWDAREKTFRHEEFEEYKAHRPHMPETLSRQWDLLPELVEAFGIPNLVQPGYEADDILGTLACAAAREGVPPVIVTGDRDALQLVSDTIRVMSTGRGITDVKVYTPAAVVERFGVTPQQIPDFIGLKGDSSDNIPGVPGVGEKTAARLLQRFGSLEAVYERLDEVTPERLRRLLREHEQEARLSKRLATMVLDVPLDEDLVALVTRGGYRLPVEEVDRAFARYEFASLRRRLKETFGGAAASPSPAGVTGVAPANGAVSVAPAAGAQPGHGEDEAGAPAAKEGGAAAPAAEAAPVRLVVEADAGPLAATLEGREAALAFAAADGGWVAAVHAGGGVVQAAALDEGRAAALWRAAAHVVAHDAKAQPGFAAAPSGPAHDTAVAAYLLAPERAPSERGFAHLTADLGPVALSGGAAEAGGEGGGEGGGVSGGEDGGEGGGEAPATAAATAAVLTWRLAAAQRPRLAALGLERLFREVELPLVRVLARMERAGVRVDLHRLGEITARVRDRLDELHDRIVALAGEEFALGSPQQLGRILFEKLGLPPVRRGKTGYSTDARVLRQLRDAHPIVPLVEEWRELSKMLGTYLEPLPARVDPATGRLHTTFHQTVTATGRLSSSDPNLQNIPVRTELGAEIRSCFVAEEGWRLVVADYSQIELRLMAAFSGEPALIEAYRRGEDVHRVTAAALAGIPVTEVTREQRERAKATNFGIMYGLSPYGLSEQVGIPVEEAKAFIEAYFEKYPKVREFRERVIAQARRDGYVTTVLGRRRAIPELQAGDRRLQALGERLAVNTVLQGSAADIIKVAMVRVDSELEGRRLAARLVLQVHDELVVEAPLAEADACGALLREAMCGAWELDPPLEVEVGVGEDWLAAKR